MKKIVKVTALLLVAAAMFAGCKKDADEDPLAGVDTGVLFSSDDVSVAVDPADITFADGDWAATIKAEYEEESPYTGPVYFTEIERAEFTVSGGDFTFTKGVTTMIEKGSFPEGVLTDEMIEEAKAQGVIISGNSFVQVNVEEATAEDLANTDFYINRLNQVVNLVPVKTNEGKTKYFGETTITNNYGETAKVTVYAMKK